MRIIIIALALAFAHAGTTRGESPSTAIEVLAAGKKRLSLKIDQNVPGELGWRKHVEVLVPRGRDLVLATQIIAYKAVTSFNNGDSAEMLSPPTYGFLLFGSDREGPTLEIRLLELFDKRDFVASSINGVYHFTYPQ